MPRANTSLLRAFVNYVRKRFITSTADRRRGSNSTEVSESGTFESGSGFDDKKDSETNEPVTIDVESDAMNVDDESDAMNVDDVSDDDDDSSSTVSEVSFSKRSFYLKLPNKLKFALVSMLLKFFLFTVLAAAVK